MDTNEMPNKMNRWMVWIAALAIVVVGGLLFMAVKPSAKVPGAIVDISDSGFLPSTISVKSGTDVQWRNSSNSVRKLTTNSNDVNAGMPAEISILAHGTYTIRFTKAGTYTFYDGTHPTSNGVVIVNP